MRHLSSISTTEEYKKNKEEKLNYNVQLYKVLKTNLNVQKTPFVRK